jgi:hypothetical protein
MHQLGAKSEMPVEAVVRVNKRQMYHSIVRSGHTALRRHGTRRAPLAQLARFHMVERAAPKRRRHL